MNKNLLEQLVQARQAQRQMMNMSTDNKNKALQNIAKTLKEHIPDIIVVNSFKRSCWGNCKKNQTT